MQTSDATTFHLHAPTSTRTGHSPDRLPDWASSVPRDLRVVTVRSVEAAPSGDSAALLARASAVVATDRSRALGPNAGIDLWWSGKHRHHGGNIQILTAPDGWPLWISQVRPGREHDTTCARTHDGLLDTLHDWTDQTHIVLADLGYEGENTRLTCPYKAPTGAGLPVNQRTYNLDLAQSAHFSPPRRANQQVCDS